MEHIRLIKVIVDIPRLITNRENCNHEKLPFEQVKERIFCNFIII